VTPALVLVAALGLPAGCDDEAPIPLPTGGLTVRVTGDDFQWHVRYPGADGVLQTADDVVTLRHLHVPANVETTVELTSRDYLYTFAVPEFRIKEVAVPDLTITWTLPAAAPGTFELRGDQLCGYSHENLMGNVVVQPPEEFVRWLGAERDRR
jgi:cytochrome c oxidase subunit 2